MIILFPLTETAVVNDADGWSFILDDSSWYNNSSAAYI